MAKDGLLFWGVVQWILTYLLTHLFRTHPSPPLALGLSVGRSPCLDVSSWHSHPAKPCSLRSVLTHCILRGLLQIWMMSLLFLLTAYSFLFILISVCKYKCMGLLISAFSTSPFWEKRLWLCCSPLYPQCLVVTSSPEWIKAKICNYPLY